MFFALRFVVAGGGIGFRLGRGRLEFRLFLRVTFFSIKVSMTASR